MGVACTKSLPAEDFCDGSDDDVIKDAVIEFNMFDKEFIRNIRKDLREAPHLFVLNNTLAAVMFFQNYKKDIDDLQKRTESNDRVLAPDAVLEKVYENVRYRPFHGPKKQVSEPISNGRLFVFSDAVKVVGSTESVEDIDKNCNKPIVRIEESQRKGFVKLREIHTSPSSVDELQIPVSRSEPTSRSSTDSDSTNTYCTLNELKTPKPIEIIKGLENRKNDFIHTTCIAHRRIRKKESDLYLEDRSPEDITEDEFYETASYISSRGYMKHFQSNLFPNQIAKQIGLTDEELMAAQTVPGKVFCTLDDVPIEVIPAIPAQWPSAQTFSFAAKSERINERRKQFVFPTPTMISDIQKLKCALVPKGYFKKEIRMDSDIEWEICFPEAQRYLESYMSHAQLKCMMFLLTIHKTFIEPKTFQYGLLPEHIRNFMLWECETNYTDWPEHRLGLKMLSLINNLMSYIAKRNLPDYFIKEKNLLENIQKKYLTFAQKVFHDILQSPLMHFIVSLRSLRYANGKSFYPPFDFDVAHKIVINMEFINNVNSSQMEINNNDNSNNKTQKILDSETQLRLIQEAKQRNKILNERYGDRRESVDSINVDWQCEKEFDVKKKKDLLTLFINTFLQIAKKCSLISTKRQTQFYLKQARYLTRILKDECGVYEDVAREFLEIIRTLEVECERQTDDTEISRVGFESHVLRKLVETKHESDKNNDKNGDKIMTGRKSVTFDAEVHKVDTNQVY